MELVSIVFSFRNEEAVLPELIRRLEGVFRNLPYRHEYIFVNDSSTDHSRDVLLQHREHDPGITILTTSRRFGIAPCILAGLRHARGDAVIYMDCDLQDPPELIPTLLARWKEGADIVHTTRTKRRGENLMKMWLTRLAYEIINRIADIQIPVNSGDFKLISRRALNELLKLDEYDPFMRGLVAWVGFKQVQVFYERDARHAGTAKFPLFRSINPYKEFIRGLTRFSDLPLYSGLIMGFLIALVSLSYLAVLFVLFLMGHPMSRWEMLLAVQLLMGGSILFMMGVLGIYIGVIHKEVKKRPHFIIADKIGGNDSAEDPANRSTGCAP
ncbi:MAG: glycosyltransferase family 2 protein [Verrucomicrobiota bacterium]